MDEVKARLTSRPTDQVIAAIQALDLEPVKVRMMDPVRGEGWTREHADGIEIAYKNFLTMLVKHPDDAEDILLSEDADEFWHTHILQTRKYAEDCQNVFGNFLHHAPHVGEVTSEDLAKRDAQAEKTKRLYEREYGARQDLAWAGASIKAGNAAWSAASIKAGNAAWSAASIKAGNAAWSAASINAENAAWSAASIKAENAAWSAASINAGNAAWSAASIKAGNAAWSAASIKAENAAWSAASIRAAKTISSVSMLLAA